MVGMADRADLRGFTADGVEDREQRLEVERGRVLASYKIWVRLLRMAASHVANIDLIAFGAVAASVLASPPRASVSNGRTAVPPSIARVP